MQVVAQKNIHALRCDSTIVIDGSLNEAIWNEAVKATDFIQSSPEVGIPSKYKTEIQTIYSENSVYFGITCYATSTDISKVLSQRDDLNSTIDYVAILLDTYNDDQNGFVFAITSRGVQYDGKVLTADWIGELNLAWYSNVKILEDRWVAELRIPYSAIRFPKVETQNWGINFIRYVASTRETSSWNAMRPDFQNDMAQCGNLIGISNIKPPLRLSFSPYVSGYLEHAPRNMNLENPWSYSVNGGLDIKYGVNEAFTIDMTLVPDFGQVQFDNQVLNLSPFEVRFNDYRPFFTEGTELFNKADLFYSRRIGGLPINYFNAYSGLDSTEIIQENPGSSQLYNAVKFSGRTKKGLGIGVFNAISGASHAIIKDTVSGKTRQVETNPLTNYNVVVFDQNLSNNSFINLTNTNVSRAGKTYDANVTSFFGKINTKTNAYYGSAKGVLSQLYFSDSVGLGHSLDAEFGKQTGQITYSVGYSEKSDTYDPNDLGFIYNNNNRQIYGIINYNIYQPVWKINRLWSSLSMTYNRLYLPNAFVSHTLTGSVGVTDKRFHTYGADIGYVPTYQHDYFEPRQVGYYFTKPRTGSFGAWVSTNYQKRFAFDAAINYSDYEGNEWNSLSLDLSPRWRINNLMFVVLSISQTWTNSELGYAVPNQSISPSNHIIFGRRNSNVTINTLNYTFTLTNRSGISFRLRHYWATVQYLDFYHLQKNGTLQAVNYTGADSQGNSLYNTNFNAFTIDFVYRWVFAPASELNFVWKNAIFQSNDTLGLTYFSNVEDLFRFGAINSLSLRVVYYFDTATLKRKGQKKG